MVGQLPEGYPDYESAMRIKAYVEEKTNGEIILEVYPDNILATGPSFSTRS